jgi:uncharacterized membrane protein YdcZ (DUF606 family)
MMSRVISEILLLIVLPFLLFMLYLISRRRNPFQLEAWRKPLSWLLMGGFILAIMVFLYQGITAERSGGVYQPPHLENGQLVPGRFQ